MVVKCRDRRDRRKKEMLVGRRRYRGQFHNLFSIVVELGGEARAAGDDCWLGNTI